MTTTAPRTTWPIRVFHYGQLAEALYNARSNRLRAKKKKTKKKGERKNKNNVRKRKLQNGIHNTHKTQIVNNELNVIRCRYDAHLQVAIHLYLYPRSAVISPTSTSDSTCFFVFFFVEFLWLFNTESWMWWHTRGKINASIYGVYLNDATYSFLRPLYLLMS